MKKLILTILLTLLLIYPNTAFANRTDSKYFTANCPILKRIISNGNMLSSTINPSTGALVSSMTPAFTIITNSREQFNLTMSACTNIQNGPTNAIFNSAEAKYIILTNSTKLPSAESINDIKSLAPTPSKNPNAIAYRIEDPQAVDNALSVSYSPSNNNWDLKLTKRGVTRTFINIPSGMPLNNTYSCNDEAGSYQAIVMLSFN